MTTHDERRAAAIQQERERLEGVIRNADLGTFEGLQHVNTELLYAGVRGILDSKLLDKLSLHVNRMRMNVNSKATHERGVRKGLSKDAPANSTPRRQKQDGKRSGPFGAYQNG